ncbi:MAG: dockerin type I repeat-containing protein [Clostridia bacterium]|nr:dockerin type I repeat-containing protein [Clostridia bacterium]
MKLFKVLSLVLAFVMLFSVLPMAVFAEGEINARDYVSHYPSESEPFVELYEEYAEGATYQWSNFGEALEGETGSALQSEPSFCSQYTCTVVLSDSTTFEVGFSTLPEIESNANEYNYYFEVSDTDKLSGYQWYSHITNDIAITTENASNECASCENSVFSSYDAETNLWSGPVIGGNGAGLHELFIFEVALKAGDRLLIDVGPEVEEIVISDSKYDFVGSPAFSLVGNIGVFDVDADETYKVTIYTPDRDSKVSACIRTYEEDVLLEGETGNEPSAPVLGNYYYCIATYNNGFTLKSASFLVMPHVLSQPDIVSREFSVTYPDDADYQWYRFDEIATPITDARAWCTEGTEGVFSAYDSENGVWNGVEYYFEEEVGYREISFFETMLEAGDVIKFETDANVEYSQIFLHRTEDENNGEWHFCDMNDDEFIFEVPTSGNYSVSFGTRDEGDITLSASVLSERIVTLEDEKDSNLKEFELGASYYCEARFPACMVLKSAVLSMIPEIIEQPTLQKPSVEVNIVEDGMKYQWYNATVEKSVVTDEGVAIINEESPAVYDSETQTWTPALYDYYEYEDEPTEYELDLFIMPVEKGHVLTFEPSEEIIHDAFIAMQWQGEDIYLEANDDGTYTFVSPKTQEYYFYFYAYTTEITVKVTKEASYLGDAIEGETEKKLSLRKSGTYACVVTYSDGTELVSECMTIKGLGDLNQDGEVTSLDYLFVKRACFGTYNLDDDERAVADINGDDDINSADYLLVKRIAFGTYIA